MYYNRSMLPIEVKSGTSRKMKSLRLFMQKRHLHHAIRTSLEKFRTIEYTDGEDADTVCRIDIIPLYAHGKV